MIAEEPPELRLLGPVDEEILDPDDEPVIPTTTRDVALTIERDLTAAGSAAWQSAEPFERAAIIVDKLLMTGRAAEQLRALGYDRPGALGRYLADSQALTLDAPTAPRESGIVERLGARVLVDVPTDPPPPLAVGFLDPLAHTILYGTGGVGKGTLASWWIGELVRAGHRVLVLDYENHPDEWSRRVDALAGRAVRENVLHVPPLAASWHGRRGAIWRQEQDVRALAEAWQATYIVVDSIVPASGGTDPLEPGTPARYAGALEYIGLPVLSLAHVTKDGAVAYPFGSVFWHNLARVTWSLARDGDRIILANRKANNYAPGGRFVVETTFLDELPREVAIRSYTAVLGERIDEQLGSDALTVAEIAARLNAERVEGESKVIEDSVSKAMRRGLQATAKRPQRYTVEGVGTQSRYRRIDP